MTLFILFTLFRVGLDQQPFTSLWLLNIESLRFCKYCITSIILHLLKIVLAKWNIIFIFTNKNNNKCWHQKGSQALFGITKVEFSLFWSIWCLFTLRKLIFYVQDILINHNINRLKYRVPWKLASAVKTHRNQRFKRIWGISAMLVKVPRICGGYAGTRFTVSFYFT